MLDEAKYQKSVDRANPGCVIFLLDMSYSMTEGIAGSSRAKSEVLATAINRFIGDLIVRCEKGEDKPRDYFDIGVIGYTTDRSNPPRSRIGSALHQGLGGRDLVSVSDLFDNPLAVEDRQRDDGAGGLVSFKFPVWCRAPQHDQMGGTPMREALQYVAGVASTWCASHPASFPPVVIHMTDGEASDGTPDEVADAAEQLRMLSTDDGNLLLLNCHLSTSQAAGVVFPSSESELPDDYAKMLFRMSSELPSIMSSTAESQGISLRPGSKGMVFNADGTQMLLMIQVGTRPSNNLR